MQFAALNDYDWQDAGTPGAEKYEIWRRGDNAYLVAFRVARGTTFRPHARATGWEHLTVVSGKWQLGESVLGPGDVAITAPGEAHENETALEDSIVVISVGNAEIPA
jgi:quercetin dioxygenase-like cupin family protein